MYEIISSVLPIFIITLIGKLVKELWLKSEDFWRGLESLSYYLLFPVLMFNYIATSDLSAFHLIKLIMCLMFATSIISVGLVFVQKKYEIDPKLFTSIFQGSIRYNSYIFFGLGRALYGNEGMEIIAVIAAYMIIFTNFLSVLVFTIYCPASTSQENSESQWGIFLKNLVANPLIFASIIGFVFNYFDIWIALSVKNTLETISNSALSIGLLCVGASLKFRSHKFDKFVIGLSCISKLIAMPAITFIILKIFGLTGISHSVGMLYASLPTATNSYILSRQLGGDSESMSTIITISIILSVLSLAILTYILA
jgi:malonate transporter